MIHSIWIIFVLYHILTYSLFFRHYFHYNIYAFILIILHRTAGPYCCLFLIFIIHLFFLWLILRDFSRLSFDYIAYSAKNTDKLWVFMIYGYKGKCNSLISILLLFCLSYWKNIQDKRRWLFFILLHFIKSLVWYQSDFIQYSYYRDFFCLGPASRLCDSHGLVWVCYFDTTKIMFWCMSLILIHMTYFSVYTIFISEHYRVIVSYIPKPGQQVSAILWNITITVWLQSQFHRVTFLFI